MSLSLTLMIVKRAVESNFNKEMMIFILLEFLIILTFICFKFMVKKSYYTRFLNLQNFVQGKDTHDEIDADSKVENHSKALKNNR